MRHSLLAILITGATLAGCGQLGTPSAGVPTAGDLAAQAAKPGAKKEGRKVTAKHVPMNEGRGAAELRVPLSAEEQALLVQLYRLHARPLPPAEFPAGLIERSSEHLAVLHAFKLPGEPAWEPSRVRQELKSRCYRDGEGNILAYETWLVGDTYQMFGKYDTQGRILKIDIETWTN